MPYESPFKYFRDQHKEPDKNKDSHFDWSPEDLAELKTVNEQEDEKKIEPLGHTSQVYKHTIETVRGAGLKAEFQSDIEEQKILDSRKEMIMKYLKALLEDARNYLTQVNYLQIQKAATYDSPAQYQSVIGESDGLRRTYHNKMISDLKIAMRLINTNFNAAFPENNRLEEEGRMIDRKGLSENELREKMAKREYFNFDYPAGIFIDFSKAPKDPQGEREYIAHWALNLYTDLSALETELEK